MVGDCCSFFCFFLLFYFGDVGFGFVDGGKGEQLVQVHLTR